MSSYPSPPRRLERSSTDRVLTGVCGGVAHYLNLDPTLVRVLTAVLTVVTGGTPILLYLVAFFLMPEERRVGPPAATPGRPGFPTPPAPAPGPWPHPPAGNDPIWGREGAPWEQPTATAPASPTPPPAPRPPTAPAASADPVDPVDPVDPADPTHLR